MLRLTFLGTGTSQGVPMIGCGCEVCRSANKRDKRLRASVMVEKIDNNTAVENRMKGRIIIDAGPDFRYQMLRENITEIDSILLTHEHKDHIGGIDDVRAFNYFQQKDTPIYATECVAARLRREFDYAFATTEKYPGAPGIELNIINPAEAFRTAGLEVTPISGRHYTAETTGYRIGKLAYLTDFNYISEGEMDKLRGVDTLVINALRHEKHISHYTVSEAIEIGRAVGARQTYFTHMSHQIGLYARIKDSLPEGFAYAYDGLRIII